MSMVLIWTKYMTQIKDLLLASISHGNSCWTSLYRRNILFGLHKNPLSKSKSMKCYFEKGTHGTTLLTIANTSLNSFITTLLSSWSYWTAAGIGKENALDFPEISSIFSSKPLCNTTHKMALLKRSEAASLGFDRLTSLSHFHPSAYLISRHDDIGQQSALCQNVKVLRARDKPYLHRIRKRPSHQNYDRLQRTVSLKDRKMTAYLWICVLSNIILIRLLFWHITEAFSRKQRGERSLILEFVILFNEMMDSRTVPSGPAESGWILIDFEGTMWLHMVFSTLCIINFLAQHF
jgi:hypothetical protein